VTSIIGVLTQCALVLFKLPIRRSESLSLPVCMDGILAPLDAARARRLDSQAVATPFRIDADDAKRREVDDFISRTFDEYAVSKLGVDEQYFQWGFEAVDSTGRTVALIRGESFLGGLIIDHFVVAKEYRRGGLGSRLLGLVLHLGRERGLGIVRLTTFAYQAPAFYLRHGFLIDFSRASGFDPVAGPLHYCSRTLSSTDCDAGAVSSPVPVTGGAAVPFVTQAGACIAIRAIPEADQSRAQAEALAMLKEYAISVTGGSWARVEPFCFVARHRLLPASGLSGSVAVSEDSAAGPIAGVVCGHTFWGGAEVEILVVDAAARRSGLGSALLAHAEDHVREAVGARIVCLQTFDFQVGTRGTLRQTLARFICTPLSTRRPRNIMAAMAMFWTTFRRDGCTEAAGFSFTKIY
jgi:GNAT superfamily N-acetyltransferase